MIQFISKYSPNFPFFDVKKLYESYECFNISGSNLSINELLSLNEFYAVLVNGKFEGCLYIHDKKDNSCFLSGFANRNAPTISGIKEFFKFIKNRFKKIYSKTEHRHAKICLLRVGFLQVDQNLFRKDL